MFPLLLSIFFLFIGALGSLCCYQTPRLARLIGCLTLFIGSLIGFFAAIQILYSGKVLTLDLPWTLPMGSLSLMVDRLSAFFMLPLFFLSSLSAIYAYGYTEEEKDQKKEAFSALCLNLLVVSMVLVLLAKNFIFFLVVWELMALLSFFLVIEEDEKEEVRRAGWIYLTATHIGTACLILLFLILGTKSGSYDFTTPAAVALPTSLFFLAVVGFGAKAGFMPFHVWLPAAHASAPSYVSALMSGVMIKTAIYALLRTLPLLGPPTPMWGWTLIAIGAASAILGALLALTQEDIKKLLAYSSIENMGIITLGLGVGFLGITVHKPLMTTLGFGGALLHVLNHTIFKGLLFFAAGAIYHSTKTRQMARLGGLLKKMKTTALAFLVGSLAISALPPFNGFVSEFLLFLSSLEGSFAPFDGSALFALLTIGSLAFVSGLNLFCFTRAYGTIFLGQPRAMQAVKAEEVSFFMRAPLFILAASSLLFGLLAPLVVKTLLPPLFSALNLPKEESMTGVLTSSTALTTVILLSTFLLLLLTLLFFFRYRLLKSRQTKVNVTWDCGYAKPHERMQYAPSGFSEPMVSFFKWILRSKSSHRMPEGYFPPHASFSHTSQDIAEEMGYKPLFQSVKWSFNKLHWLQGGNLQLYILYIALTLFILLIWKT